MTNFDRLPAPGPPAPPAAIYQDNSEIGGLDSFPHLSPCSPLSHFGLEPREPRNTSGDSFVHLSILGSDGERHGPNSSLAWRWAWKSGFLSPGSPRERQLMTIHQVIHPPPPPPPTAARSDPPPTCPANNPRTGNERKTTTAKQMDNAESESALSSSTSKISGRLSSD